MICKYCAGSGHYIDYGCSIIGVSDILSHGVIVDCKACGGTGHFGEEDLITVPKKYVKEEYWKN